MVEPAFHGDRYARAGKKVTPNARRHRAGGLLGAVWNTVLELNDRYCAGALDVMRGC